MSTSVESAVSSEFEFPPLFPRSAMQSGRTREGDDGSSMVSPRDSQKQSQGRWQCASCSPVLLEMAHCQTINGDKPVIVPQQIETSGQFELSNDEPPQPPISTSHTEVAVNNDKLSVYGLLRAKQEDNEITIVVEPGRSDHSNIDLHCKL